MYESQGESIWQAGGRAGGSHQGAVFRGSNRSGATLLGRLLAEVPGFVAVGELRYIWEHSLVENRRCGCGLEFRSCPFWTAVGDHAYGGWTSLDINQVLSLHRSVARHRYLPLLLVPGLWPPFQRRLAAYVAILERLYAAVEAVAGSRVIVDWTRDLSFALLLRQVPTLDVRIAHLVRDSRAVAFSWTKKMRDPAAIDSQTFFPTYHPLRTATRWTAYNLLFDVLGKSGTPRLLMRYEDSVNAPQHAIEEMMILMGDTPPTQFPFLDGTDVLLQAHHTMAGNRMRLMTGRLPLRVDNEWRTQMPRRDRFLVGLVTWPVLMRYGYLARSAKARQATVKQLARARAVAKSGRRPAQP